MQDKLQTDIVKSLMTALFAGISYLFCGMFQITKYFLTFSDKKWHITVSVAIYTALLNAIFLYIISKRTLISVEIMERKDKSNTIKLSDKPRAIAIKVVARGNLKKISGDIVITFPKWIDVTPKGSPDLKPDPKDTQRFLISLTDFLKDSPNEGGTFFFDINMNETYINTERIGTIQASFSGSSLRYAKDFKSMSLHA